MISKMRYILVAAMVCLTITAIAQDPVEEAPVEWFLDEVIRDSFVKECSFDYYYTPSASDMMQQRAKGEVAYFLSSPPGLNRKRVCTLIDGIMESQDDVTATNDWQTTNTTCWKEFSRERNKFRVSVKNAALDDGTYYVSVTETANYYKKPAKKAAKQEKAAPTTKRSKRITDRKPVVVPDNDGDQEEASTDLATTLDEEVPDEEAIAQVSKREREEAKRLEQEKQREQARAEKEAEKLRKAEEKKAKQEQQALLKEQERLKKEQEKQLKEEERQRQAAEKQQQALARQEQKKARQRQAEYDASKFHYSDVALWLSDKYDFTQTAGVENSITMYSIAIKDVEMAKLAIKNALKGSNARMAMPWRVNSQNGTIETGYSVDGHVLVFAIGNNDDGNITLSITEMDNDAFEAFRQGGLL